MSSSYIFTVCIRFFLVIVFVYTAYLPFHCIGSFMHIENFKTHHIYLGVYLTMLSNYLETKKLCCLNCSFGCVTYEILMSMSGRKCTLMVLVLRNLHMYRYLQLPAVIYGGTSVPKFVWWQTSRKFALFHFSIYQHIDNCWQVTTKLTGTFISSSYVSPSLHYYNICMCQLSLQVRFHCYVSNQQSRFEFK